MRTILLRNRTSRGQGPADPRTAPGPRSRFRSATAKSAPGGV